MNQKRIYFSLAALLFIVLLGMLGYHLLEGWSLFDSLYMTIITLATIGYSEVHPLTFAGRVFTLVLIVLGVTAAGFIFTSLTQLLVEIQLLKVSLTYVSGSCGRRTKWLTMKLPPSPFSTTTLSSWPSSSLPASTSSSRSPPLPTILCPF